MDWLTLQKQTLPPTTLQLQRLRQAHSCTSVANGNQSIDLAPASVLLLLVSLLLLRCCCCHRSAKEAGPRAAGFALAEEAHKNAFYMIVVCCQSAAAICSVSAEQAVSAWLPSLMFDCLPTFAVLMASLSGLVRCFHHV